MRKQDCKVLIGAAVGAAIIAMAGCGGGGGGGAVSTDASTAPAAAPTPTISGVTASGAPIANAAMTVTCADATTKTGTADGQGAYSIAVDGCAAPYVVTASGVVGDAQQTLVSVQPTTVVGEVTVNVTPITHAIAATLASDGNPLTLASDIATEKANLTATAVQERKDALAAALAPVLTQAGVTGTFDLVNTKFAADRTQFDKVLDNVKVVVTPSGVTITNVAGAKVDDMGNMSGKTYDADLSASSLTISRSTDFKAPLAKLPAAADDAGIADTLQSALNACFSAVAAARGTFASPQGACATLPFASDYLHNGRDGAQEFDRYLTSSRFDGATFAQPEVIRFFRTAADDTRALVRFPYTRADGVADAFDTVAERSTATGGTVKFRGNQRLYRTFVNGFVTRRTQVAARGNQAKGSYYYTGINLYFGYREGGAGGAATSSGGPARGTGRKVAYVKVSGPGLPTAGIILNPLLNGCDGYYAIAPAATTAPTACTSLFRMQSRAVSATDTDNVAANFGTDVAYAAAPVSDAALAAIEPFSAYKFEIFNEGNATAAPDLVYVERLRSRPIALGTVSAGGEVDKLRWNTALSQETTDAIDPTATGKTFTGGSTFTVKWSNVTNTPPIGSLQVQTRPAGTLFQDETGVGFKQTSVALTNSGVAWPDMSKTTGTGNFNLVSLRARNHHDLQFFNDWRY